MLEQQDANQKNKTLEELEKIPSGVINLDEEEMKEILQDDVQAKSYGHTITANAKAQRKACENANVKRMNIEEDQTHLKPTIVDTSLVKGQIIQVCCKKKKKLLSSLINTH